jgi:RNA polymerase sigma factor (sigma-70 family)
MKRRSGDRRVVLAANLDRLDATCALWAPADLADAQAADLADALRAAIVTELTDKQREVVEAYFFEGQSQAAIARRFGVTQQVVQKRLFGARRGDKIVGGALARLRRAMALFRRSARTGPGGS